MPIEKKPGPGQYDEKLNLIKPSIPSCDIGKGNDGKQGREFFLKIDNPAPGTYNVD